jgi:predicted  nucleic acid-binding Zn-ribbon protein
MSHRCVRCGKIYPSTAPEVLKGCSSCGSHYFFFFKDEDLKFKEETDKLTREEREEILEDVKDIVGHEPEKPIILDLESIRVRKSGKFEIDLVSLFKRKPVIYKLEDGKYIIDIASTFQLKKNKDTVEFPEEEEEKTEEEIEKEEQAEEKKEEKSKEEKHKKDKVEKEKEEKKEKEKHDKEIKAEYVDVEKVKEILDKAEEK